MTAPDSSLPFSTRVWFAWVCFFRVLFDGSFAARALAAGSATGDSTLDAAESEAAPSVPLPAAKPAAEPAAAAIDSALQLLALLQRDGRLVDFLQQDVSAFPDADIGAAARVVHDGCRKALSSHLTIEAIRVEPEGARVTLDAAFDPAEVKLVGNVSGAAPYRGTLRHRGWRVSALTLPKPMANHDARVLAPAEVEL